MVIVSDCHAVPGAIRHSLGSGCNISSSEIWAAVQGKINEVHITREGEMESFPLWPNSKGEVTLDLWDYTLLLKAQGSRYVQIRILAHTHSVETLQKISRFLAYLYAWGSDISPRSLAALLRYVGKGESG